MRLALALAVVVLALLVPIGAVASSKRAHIAFASITPVSVRGAGFKAGERVAVTVTAKVTKRKTVTAGSHGGFLATFGGFGIGRCQAYSASAKGNRGSSASAKLIPECAMP